MAKRADTSTDGPPHPRAHFTLYGLEEAEATLADALTGNRLHHAWLLTGPRGIGKATLAYRAARRALGAEPDPSRGLLGADPADPVCRRIAAEAHTDCLVLERPLDDRGGRKAEIPVDAARAAGQFFARTSGEGGRRVCLIDAADELTLQGANAILKTLEEPPAGALFFLVAHAPGRLPATIASRCRRLVVRTPDPSAAVRAVREIGAAGDADAQACAKLAKGRAGEAVRLYMADAQKLARELDIALSGDSAAAISLADRLSARAMETQRSLIFEWLRERMRETAAKASDPQQREALIEAWSAVGALEGDLVRLRMDPKLAVRMALLQAQRASA